VSAARRSLPRTGWSQFDAHAIEVVGVMRPSALRSLKTLVILLGVAATVFGPGCFQQDNNAEFLRTAPAADPPENPNESYAEHKARTRRTSAVEKKVEAKLKAAAEAKAKAKSASQKP
jgi:hypothetical protein